MPLSFPWENPDSVLIKGRRYSIRKQFNPLNTPSRRQNRAQVAQEVPWTPLEVKTLIPKESPAEHPDLPKPDPPEVAKQQEEEYDRLYAECFQLYCGHLYEHLPSAYDEFLERQRILQEAEASLLPPRPASFETDDLSSRPSLDRSLRRYSSVEVVSPRSLFQQTLDDALPSIPSTPHLSYYRASLGTSYNNELITSSEHSLTTNSTQQENPVRYPLFRHVSSKLKLFSPRHQPHPILPKIPHNPDTPEPLKLRQRHPTLTQTPSITDTPEPLRIHHRYPILPRTPNTPDTPEPLRPYHRSRLPESPSDRQYRPTLLWRSDSSSTDRRSSGIGFHPAGSDRSPLLPPFQATPPGWSSLHSALSSPRSYKSSNSAHDMGMELRKRRPRVQVEKLEARSAGSAEQVKRKNPFVDESKLFRRNSRLINRDVHGVFANPQAFKILTTEEKKKLSSLLEASLCLDHDGVPKSYFLKHSMDWSAAVRHFQEDLSAGRYEPEWLEDALEAASRRREGSLDNWKDQNFEEHWGQKTKFVPIPQHEESRNVTLSELAKKEFFHIGDTWTYCRILTPPKESESIRIEKEVRLDRIDSDGKILFSIPSGQQKTFPHPLPPLPRKPVPSSSPSRRPGSSRSTGRNTRPSSPVKVPEQTPEELDSFIADMEANSSLTPDVNLPTFQSPMNGLVATTTRPESSLAVSGTENVTGQPANKMPLKNTIQSLASSPEELEASVMEADGRCTNRGPLSGNVWKLFRCHHDKKDVGTLWDIRQRLVASSQTGIGATQESAFL